MPTTSLKLPDALKARIAAVAESQGTSAHAFMVKAIEASTSAAERRAAFLADAEAAYAETLASNEVYAAEDVHAYLRARLRGEDPPPPPAKSWRA